MQADLVYTLNNELVPFLCRRLLFLSPLPERFRLYPRPPRARLAATRNFARGTKLTNWLAPIFWYPGNPATLKEILPLTILTLLRPPAVRRRRRRPSFVALFLPILLRIEVPLRLLFLAPAAAGIGFPVAALTKTAR